MTWLFAHMWIIILAAIYLAWCAYCIWDGIMWHKWEKDVIKNNHQWWIGYIEDPYGAWFSLWLILHVFGLFAASIVLFFRAYY